MPLEYSFLNPNSSRVNHLFPEPVLPSISEIESPKDYLINLGVDYGMISRISNVYFSVTSKVTRP